MLADPRSKSAEANSRANTVAGLALVFINAVILAPISLYVIGTAAGTLRIVAVFAVAMVSLRGLWRLRTAMAEPPDLDPEAVPKTAAMIDPALVKWRRELLYGRSSQRYFERVLWPRLVELAGAGSRLPAPPRPSPWRRWLKRGPRLSVLLALIKGLEAGR